MTSGGLEIGMTNSLNGPAVVRSELLTSDSEESAILTLAQLLDADDPMLNAERPHDTD